MTKAELVTAALREIGIADHEFDISPGELVSGAKRLDQMMYHWYDRGIKFPYNYEGGLTDNTGIPTVAEEAAITNLALRLAPSYGKQVDIGVQSVAKQAMTSLFRESAYPEERYLQLHPVGAGYKSYDRNWAAPRRRDQWRVDEFDDYSGGESVLHVGDEGVVLRVEISGAPDLVNAIGASIRYRKPSGDTGEWPGTVGEDYVEHIVEEEELDEPGVWYLQAKLDFGNWNIGSKTTSIRVQESIELT